MGEEKVVRRHQCARVENRVRDPKRIGYACWGGDHIFDKSWDRLRREDAAALPAEHLDESVARRDLVAVVICHVRVKIDDGVVACAGVTVAGGIVIAVATVAACYRCTHIDIGKGAGLALGTPPRRQHLSW